LKENTRFAEEREIITKKKRESKLISQVSKKWIIPDSNMVFLRVSIMCCMLFSQKWCFASNSSWVNSEFQESGATILDDQATFAPPKSQVPIK
jgi:hypothetical protein